MICIPVAPESRTLGRADLLNAARQADLVELCLDRFIKTPDVGELIAGLDKPVLISCRRRKDGGNFEGTEEERLALLREALTARPAIIELELDIAAQIPRTSGTKRLIAVNRPFRAVTDIAALQQQAMQVGADVLKVVWPGVLLDSLEPVLAAMQQGPKPPIVGTPIGHGGRSFSILARRLKAPWVYASLEQGMETHDGMPTLHELEDQYHIRGVNADTRLIGIVGFGNARERTLRAFNLGLQELELNCRAIPLEIGPLGRLGEHLQRLDIAAVVVMPDMGEYVLPLAEHPEPAVALGQHVDLLLLKRDGWHGYNVLWRSLLKVVDRTLRRQSPEPLSLETTTNLILGSNRLTKTLLYGLKQLKGRGIVSVAGKSDEVSFCPHCGEALDAPEADAEPISATLDASFVPFTEINSTRPDVLFLTDPAVKLGFGPTALNPLLLQPPLVVVDADSLLQESDILAEARARNCRVVRPSYILGEHLAAQFRAVTGKELPESAFQQALHLETTGE